MSWKTGARKLVSPPRLVGEHDTGLRFTDILFGFVIRELFIRLQNWPDLPTASRYQLVTATVLVLGSWIGFRRSVTRTDYELKFFNLPFFRFVLDQVMVVLYFRIAKVTPEEPSDPIVPAHLAHETITTMALIFILYLLWDLLGIAMTFGSKYPEIDRKKKEATDTRSRPNYAGLIITSAFTVLIGGLLLTYSSQAPFDMSPLLALGIATGLLLVYRWVKEVRSSWDHKDKPAPDPGVATAS